MEVDGQDVRPEPFEERRNRLSKLALAEQQDNVRRRRSAGRGHPSAKSAGIAACPAEPVVGEFARLPVWEG